MAKCADCGQYAERGSFRDEPAHYERHLASCGALAAIPQEDLIRRGHEVEIDAVDGRMGKPVKYVSVIRRRHES